MLQTASTSPRWSTGRIVGVLLLLHLPVGLIVPFVLLHPVATPGFLGGAAGFPGQIRVAVLLLFAGNAIVIGIASAAWPVFRQYSPAMALWLLALAVASFSLQAVDNAHILSMLSLSQEYARASAADAGQLQVLAVVVGAARRWSHYTALLVSVGWICVFCSLLYRFRLVPRALAALGALTSVLQIAGVSLRGLLGYSPEMRLAMPLAPAYLALAVWLMVKGFEERHRPLPAEGEGVEFAGGRD